MFVLFVDIDGIVDHHCFNFPFIKIPCENRFATFIAASILYIKT
jgi:hypothetical protein